MAYHFLLHSLISFWSVSICLPLSHSLSLSLILTVSVLLSLILIVSPYLSCLCFYLSVSSLSLSVSLCLFVSLSLCLFVLPSLCLYVSLSLCPCLSVYLFPLPCLYKEMIKSEGGILAWTQVMSMRNDRSIFHEAKRVSFYCSLLPPPRPGFGFPFHLLNLIHTTKNQPQKIARC